MWVFCCGMKRSGSTVQYQITREIVETNGLGKALGWVEPAQFPQLKATYTDFHGFLVVKSHRYLETAEDLFMKKQAKAVYVYRDIRDVVISMMEKYQAPFWKIVASGNIQRILKDYQRWNGVNDILVSRYDTMVADLQLETLRIADHLGVKLNDRSARGIAQKYSLEQQLERIRGFDYNNVGAKSGSSTYDPVSLLHPNHIRSGKTGQWTTRLSGIQSALIEDIGFIWLIEKGYSVESSWASRKAAVVRYSPCWAGGLVRPLWRRIRKVSRSGSGQNPE